MRGGGETKLEKSPNGVRTPAGSKGTNIVRELTVALAQSQAARSLHSGGRPDKHGTAVALGSAGQWPDALREHHAACIMCVITRMADGRAYQDGATPEPIAPMTSERTARHPRLPAAPQPPVAQRVGLDVLSVPDGNSAAV